MKVNISYTFSASTTFVLVVRVEHITVPYDNDMMIMFRYPAPSSDPDAEVWCPLPCPHHLLLMHDGRCYDDIGHWLVIDL